MKINNQLLGAQLDTDVVPLAWKAAPAFSETALAGHRVPSGGPTRFHLGAVDLRKVTSVCHSRHTGSTWGELLGTPRTKSTLRNIRDPLDQLRTTPDYYLEQSEKPGWMVYEVDGEFFLESGLHRTVVGRYFLELNGLDPTVHGIAVFSMSRREWLDCQQASLEQERMYGSEWPAPDLVKTGSPK